MYIGQFGNSLKNMVCGMHLTANSNDFSGNSYDGTDTDISYDAAAGIIGGAGAQFNGVSSKIKLNTYMDSAYISGGSYSFVVLVKYPSSAPATQPIFARGIVAVSGSYYGTGLVLYSNQAQFVRHVGGSTGYTINAPFTFESDKRYLVGVTVNKSTSTATIYIYPLDGGARGIGSGTFAPVSVGYHTSYDQGLHLGANLRNVSNVYSSLSMSEMIIMSTILTNSWFTKRAAYLRGFL